MFMISVWSKKGGVGKTLLSLQLAGMFASKGKKVNVIDLDPQGGSMLFAELAQRSSSPLPFEISRKPIKDSEILIFDHSPGVDLGGKLAPMVVVPTLLDASSYSSTLKTIQHLEEEKRDYILLPNRVEMSIREHAELLERLQKEAEARAKANGYYDSKYQMPYVRKRIAYQRGYNYGQTVYATNSGLPAVLDARKEINGIGNEIGRIVKASVHKMKAETK
ncbi:ParA family protein [Pantoea allii]|nr:ParA family protein [Pantoea allii]THB84432.1 ParA family protein [Pantoea allii]